MKKTHAIILMSLMLAASAVALADDDTPTFYLTGNQILNGGPNVDYRYLGKQAETFTQTIMFNAGDDGGIYNLRTSTDENNCQKYLPNYSTITLTCSSPNDHLLLPISIPKHGHFNVTINYGPDNNVVGFTMSGESVDEPFCGAGSANSNFIASLLVDQSGAPATCTLTMAPSTSS